MGEPDVTPEQQADFDPLLEELDAIFAEAMSRESWQRARDVVARAYKLGREHEAACQR